MEEEKKTKKENVLAGIVGAFLGSLIGVLCTVVIGQLGYVASVSGLVMAVCALKGYELLSGGILSKKGAAVSSVLGLVLRLFLKTPYIVSVCNYFSLYSTLGKFFPTLFPPKFCLWEKSFYAG